MEKKFGKIQYVHYGFCGYQDAMLGLRVTLGGDGWGVGADKPGHWTTRISNSTEWTEADRIQGFGKNANEILELLRDAKVQSVDQLKDIPVECTFEGNSLKSWRILKEVL